MWRKILIAWIWGTISCGVAAGEGRAPGLERPVVGHAAPGEARRIALVIGNAAYGADPLDNAVNDGRVMSSTLGLLGFEVIRHENLTRQRMEEAILEFDRRLGSGGLGLFYFAGHGFRVGDRTLLVPVDADPRAPARLIEEGMDLRAVIDGMSRPRPGKTNLIVLDMCLSTPFATGGAGFRELPGQTLVAYAAAPGSFAADGSRHGVYTAELLRAMLVPGQDVHDLFRRVAEGVRKATGERQVPWVASTLSSRISLLPGPAGAASPASPLSVPAEVALAMHSRAILPKESAYELAFWESIKDSNHISDYEAYLEAYPNGRFAPLARARIERLRAAASKGGATPAEPARPAPAGKPPAKETAPPPAVAPAPKPAAPAPATKVPEPAPATKPDRAPPAAASPEAGKAPARAAGSETQDCPACPVLVALPKGAFTMGSNSDDPSERPAHPVTIGEAFWIGKYEVTVEQWGACVEAGAFPALSAANNRSKNAPARDISWDDAQQYVKWLSKITGKPYRLPTEAEWEYAARGGTSTRYWWGEQMRAGNANCKECGQPWQQEGPADVGSFAANGYGIHDTSGSVWEWVSDCWHNSYKGAPSDGRSWDEADCRVRVIRGGSWREGASYMLSSTRFKYDASVRNSQNGFRVARSLK